MENNTYVTYVVKDTSLKRYEKVALLRFFALFLGAFMLMFLLLGSLYYLQESSRLTKELELTTQLNYIECIRLQMGDCFEYKNAKPPLDSLYKDIFYALALVLVFFIPISLFLSFFALKPVRTASTMIDNFIANIVHDINTPIATIMLNAKSILRKSKEEPKKLKRILSSAKQLTNMQHDLLALADENSEIEKELVDLKSISEEIVDGFRLQYSSQPFEASVEHQNIEVNLVDIRRILQNLFSNAVKYNKDEKLIKIYTQDKCLIIEDQGKGMENPEKVFEKNYREDYSIQGNGLGLASVLAMLERNNIKIDVKSKINSGTKIVLNFR
ncbi:MAG: Two-component system histidine kinase DccS [uncultured Sulfurovum sp.]|uniref:histidine kinase n=1 Tax=uncultured Sulfurovum sp. TaxID=269237 RepID=A0A6S6T654_9BACT|nr:MAG: Two-component system histidine kinase DccS [uncultured Sulfurovum sp.]